MYHRRGTPQERTNAKEATNEETFRTIKSALMASVRFVATNVSL